METVLGRRIFNTRVILSGMQGNPSHALQPHHGYRRLMRVGERQQHAVDAQLTRPSCRRAAEPHVRPPVGRARDLDLTPPDAACEGRALERLVDGLLSGEAYGDMGRGVGPTLAVRALIRCEQ